MSPTLLDEMQGIVGRAFASLEHTLPCVGGKAVATVGNKNAKVTRLSTKTIKSTKGADASVDFS